MQFTKWLALVLLTTGLASCAATPPTPAPTPVKTAIPTLPAEAQATTPTPTLPDDALAIYHKSGGIAGIDETLTVHQGGMVELDSRGADTRTAKLDEPMVQLLRRMLEQQEFTTLAPLYAASGADLFVYTITARGIDGQVRTVTAMDSAAYPSYFGVLIAMLEQIKKQVPN